MRRVARALAGVSFLALAASDGRAQGPPPADPTDLQRAVFTLEDARYQILLPERVSLVPPSGQVKSVIITDASKSQRLERQLILGGTPSGAEAGSARTVTLASGGVLSYGVQDNVGGGSGGPIAELTGRLQIGARTVAVTCTDQSELLREPDWCVPYLHHLRIDGHR